MGPRCHSWGATDIFLKDPGPLFGWDHLLCIHSARLQVRLLPACSPCLLRVSRWGKRAPHCHLLLYWLQDRLENCLLGGFFHIFKVKADFPEPAQHPARYLILFKYANCCSGFSCTSAYHPADKIDLHLRASLCFLPVHQAKNTSPIPARHPGLPSDKQIIG